MAETFKLNPKLAVFLTPTPFALTFALKGIIAMALALYVSMLMDFDRPYWAMISAVFLQIRPESGQVIEKGMFQLLGTILGGGIGLLVLALFVQASALALATLSMLVFVCATFSAMTHNFNVTYFCAMIAATMILVVVISVASTPTSNSIFEVAVQRVSEIGIGSICATLVSMLLWPVRVRQAMVMHANDVIAKAFASVELHLDPEDKRTERHASLLGVIDSVMLLEADTSPVIYEGPTGPGRARAAHLLSQRTLSLIAEMQVLGHFIREHPDWIDDVVSPLMEDLRNSVHQAKAEQDHVARRELMVALRKRVNAFDVSRLSTALQHRAVQAIQEVVQLMLVMLDARGAVENAESMRLKAVRISRHHDVLLSVIIGLRSSLMFALASILWIASGWDTAFLMMVMLVIFSVMFASFPAPTMIIRFLIVGTVAALPVGILFGGVLLANAPRDFEMLIMVFGAPLFIALMGFTNRMTLAYSLGFCLTYIIMTLPGNAMTFDVVGSVERGLTVLIGVIVLHTLFRLVVEPNALIMRRRLISATAMDISELGTTSQSDVEEWFNGRMFGRIQRLARYENNLSDRQRSQRNLIEQGLLGLNLGHVVIKQARRLAMVDDQPRMRVAMRRWQQSLAQGYQASAWGVADDQDFLRYTRLIYRLMRDSGRFEPAQLKQFEGLCYRLLLSLRRNAGVSEDQIQQLETHLLSDDFDVAEPPMDPDNDRDLSGDDGPEEPRT
ncbi:FUSC family protein [Halotalea alkalilenta]|uniref:FUSC family protein n=1 Tax=Halotalea alkalilenta TaxID=376489 RepID=UPI0006940B8B|nr:FUSC family protein [Halotalea alkalilenta]